MSILLAILCLNAGVALGMVLSGVLHAQRHAHAAAPSQEINVPRAADGR